MSDKRAKLLKKTTPPSAQLLTKKLKRARDEEEDEHYQKLIKYVHEPEPTGYNPYSPSYSPTYIPGSYSPTSPQYSPLSPSSTTEEDEEDDQSIFHTGFFKNNPVPFGTDLYKDAFLLDPECKDHNVKIDLSEKENKAINLFSRNIQSYKTGDKISKHCGPWGECTFLFGSTFRIKKKIFAGNGTLAFVLLRDTEPDHYEYMISTPFFSGWVDGDALDTYYDY